MQSVIVTFINSEWDECVSIGSYGYYEKIKKTCKQIVSIIQINQTEQQWYELMELSQQELLCTLIDFQTKNTKFLFFPN